MRTSENVQLWEAGILRCDGRNVICNRKWSELTLRRRCGYKSDFIAQNTAAASLARLYVQLAPRGKAFLAQPVQIMPVHYFLPNCEVGLLAFLFRIIYMPTLTCKSGKFWLKFPVLFLSLSSSMPKKCIEIGHVCCLPHVFKFTIHSRYAARLFYNKLLQTSLKWS